MPIKKYYYILFSILSVLFFSSCSVKKMHQRGYQSIKSYQYYEYFRFKDIPVNKQLREINIALYQDPKEPEYQTLWKHISLDTNFVSALSVNYNFTPLYDSVSFSFGYTIYPEKPEIYISHYKNDELNETEYKIEINSRENIYTFQKFSEKKQELFQLSDELIQKYTQYCIDLKDSVDYLPFYAFPDVSSCTKLLKSDLAITNNTEGHYQHIQIHGELKENEFVIDTAITETYTYKFDLDDKKIFVSHTTDPKSIRTDSVEFYKNEGLIKRMVYIFDKEKNDTIYVGSVITECQAEGIYENIEIYGKSKIKINPFPEIDVNEKYIERWYNEYGDLLSVKAKAVTVKGVKAYQNITQTYNKKGERLKCESRNRYEDTHKDNRNIYNSNFSCEINEPSFYDSIKFLLYHNGDYRYLATLKLDATKKAQQKNYYKTPILTRIKNRKKRKNYKHENSYGSGYTKLISIDKKNRREKRIEDHDGYLLIYEIQYN